MARAVRISRHAGEPPGTAPVDPSSDGYRPNTAALTRSGRLFAVFLVVLVASYAIFLGLLGSSSAAGTAGFTDTILYLTGLAGAMALYGFAITLGRTPRGIERGGPKLVVVEFLGTRRVYPIDGSFQPIVENRYGAGWLAPGPTEMVALRSARGPLRHYLVEPGMLPAPAR